MNVDEASVSQEILKGSDSQRQLSAEIVTIEIADGNSPDFDPLVGVIAGQVGPIEIQILEVLVGLKVEHPSHPQFARQPVDIGSGSRARPYVNRR
jgi:hypothetical protein